MTVSEMLLWDNRREMLTRQMNKLSLGPGQRFLGSDALSFADKI